MNYVYTIISNKTMTPEQKKIEEGNALIGAFDGWIKQPDFVNGDDEVFPYYEKDGRYIHHHPQYYHKKWGWLMPVVEKIGKLTIDRFPINVTLSTTGIYIAFNHSNCHGDHKEGQLKIVDTLNINYFNLDENNQTDMITSCWLGIVEFIEWYNTERT
jgi:hypothetical protein